MRTFLDRYAAGDRVEVWNELVALGDAVRREPVQADAIAVAEETMRRARYNIELVITHLAAMGYRFAAPAIERELDRIHKNIMEPKFDSFSLRHTLATLRKRKLTLEAELERMATIPPLENPRVFYPPEEQTINNLKGTETVAKGPLPISIRTWYKHVGYVSLGGAHPVLNPDGCATADPLAVCALPDLMKGLVIGERNGKIVLSISLSDRGKAELEGGMPYTITIPNSCADVELENEWRRTTFVHYLRKAFEWGGFPGWERDPSPPRNAIAELSEGLLPI